MRRLAWSLIAGLLAMGLWAQAGAVGYERGKADATHALTPYGAVVVYKDGTCQLFDQPGQQIAWEGGPARTHVTFVIQPGLAPSRPR